MEETKEKSQGMRRETQGKEVLTLYIVYAHEHPDHLPQKCSSTLCPPTAQLILNRPPFSPKTPPVLIRPLPASSPLCYCCSRKILSPEARTYVRPVPTSTLCPPDLHGPVATISSRRAIILTLNLSPRKQLAPWAIERGLTANSFLRVPHFLRAPPPEISVHPSCHLCANHDENARGSCYTERVNQGSISSTGAH